jgi:hypothetical protein
VQNNAQKIGSACKNYLSRPLDQASHLTKCHHYDPLRILLKNNYKMKKSDLKGPHNHFIKFKTKNVDESSAQNPNGSSTMCSMLLPKYPSGLCFRRFNTNCKMIT